MGSGGWRMYGRKQNERVSGEGSGHLMNKVLNLQSDQEAIKGAKQSLRGKLPSAISFLNDSQ